MGSGEGRQFQKPGSTCLADAGMLKNKTEVVEGRTASTGWIST